jgi:hypothetical protein
MRATACLDAIRKRPDRRVIKEAWTQRAIDSPLREIVQADGRIKRWVRVPEMDNRFLRVILLSDCERVHNAFGVCDGTWRVKAHARAMGTGASQAFWCGPDAAEDSRTPS